MNTAVLIVLDGWGHGQPTPYNAIHVANTPVWDEYWASRPTALLECSGEHVGLPPGQMGNSEVGHMIMGAGRVVHQDFTRINSAIDDGSFMKISVIRELLKDLGSRRVHVLGLYSPGGVHSHEEQINFLVGYLLDVTSEVSVHCFLDGRDTPPQSAHDSLVVIERLLQTKTGTGVASISGRYYAMDRDQRWERTELAFEMLTNPTQGKSEDTAMDALERSYARKETDEFVRPTQTKYFAPIRDDDIIIFMNFRADRARQLSSAFVLDEFTHFERKSRPKLSTFISLTPYSKEINESNHATPVKTLFPMPSVSNSIGEYLANRGLRQLRVAESEKYAHVTYFFSGGRELCFPNEDRKIVASPNVKTYDLKPEMSAEGVTDTVVSAIESGSYAMIVCNFANGDMVGHTGLFSAAVKAVECLDHCLERIFRAGRSNSAHCFITADHGNVEHLYDTTTEQPNTAHTNNPVPFLYVGPFPLKFRPSGALADIAPTILDVLQLPIPSQMTGKSMLV